MLLEKETIKCEVAYSDDRKHRYMLKRVWNKEKPIACVITIQPSMANNLSMDMTTFLTINGVANLEDYGGIIIVNLFSIITSKLHMRWARDIDINDPENDNYIKKAAEESSVIILAYGKGVLNNVRITNRIDHVLKLLSKHQDKFRVISDGEKTGLHPLSPSTRSVVWKLEPFIPQEKEQKPETDEAKTESVPT